MKVPVVKSWDQAGPYLDMLAQTVINDVSPLLKTTGGAPHAIAREVFSYVDYLGALYVGKDNVQRGPDGLAVVVVRFTRYLQEVMALADSNYGGQAEVIYQMYRCGPVHEFDPKVLRNNKKQILAWFSYRGPRQATYKEWNNKPVHHLQPVQAPHDRALFYLPVSTICLVQDLLNSVERFKQGVGATAQRSRCWNQAARILNQPKEFNFTV